MLRPATTLLVLLAACQIPDERFAPIVDGGPMGKAYAFDPAVGIYQLKKNVRTGELKLTGASPTPAGGATSGFTNKQGTHLYALATQTSQIYNFAINSNGSLRAAPPYSIAPCAPVSAALDPSGAFLAIACSGGQLAIVAIANDGTLGPTTLNTGGVALEAVTFTPDGLCLYAADPGGPMASTVLIYRYDAATGVATRTGAVSAGAAHALATSPDGNLLYAARDGELQWFFLAQDCSISSPFPQPLSSIGEPRSITVAPSGPNVFVTGAGVAALFIQSSGDVVTTDAVRGSPFLTEMPSLDAATMDPAMPNTLYLTGHLVPGLVSATVGPTGAIASTTQLALDNVQWLQLAP